MVVLNEALFVLVFLAIGFALMVAWVVALVDALRVPAPTWEAAGQSQVLWVLVIVLLGLLGAILYAVMARPAIKRVGPPAF